MELNFKNKNGVYEAQVKVNGDFNIHVERPKTSLLKIYQKSSEEGQYASESSWGSSKEPKVIDEDFSMLVYPKVVKIVSGASVSKASVDCKEGVSVVIPTRLATKDDFTRIYKYFENPERLVDQEWLDTYTVGEMESLRFETNLKLKYVGPNSNNFADFSEYGFYSFANLGGGGNSTFNTSDLFVLE